MGGKSSKNAWEVSETTSDIAHQEDRTNTAEESAYSSAIPAHQSLPHPPQEPQNLHQPRPISANQYGSNLQQPASYLQQTSPHQQRPTSYPQQPSPHTTQQPPPYPGYLQQQPAAQSVANGNAPIYYNQVTRRYEHEAEPIYQTQLYDKTGNRLSNGHTATLPTTSAETPPPQQQPQVQKSSKKSKSSKSKKKKGKSSPEKKNHHDHPASDSSSQDNEPVKEEAVTRTIPRAVFDRERFMSEHGYRPNTNIHVDPTQSTEDSGRGSYEKNDDVKTREPPRGREENIVYTATTKTDKAMRPLLNPAVWQNVPQSGPSSMASEPLQHPETETRSNGSRSHDWESTESPRQPTGVVQVLPSEPFREWNRPYGRGGEHGTGSPTLSGNRREVVSSTETGKSFVKEFPDTDY